MKILTLNFLTCAVKACKSSSQSFPLHPKDAELVQDTIELNPKLLVNILPRIDWNALIVTSSEVRHFYIPSPASPIPPVSILARHLPLITVTSYNLRASTDAGANFWGEQQLGFPTLPASPPTAEELAADEKMQRELHALLMETQISEGKLVCGNCGHEYAIHEGIANFLLPSHLV
jgi:multifunctional methyltransferase subunit TRM112